MLWYYTAIIDWMIANPGRPLSECAKYVGRTQTTLSIIINSDMFKAALAQRKAEFQAQHDFSLIEKTTKVAHASLDAILTTLEKKKDAVPLDRLQQISDSALGRLGYGAKPLTQAVQVNNFNGPSQVFAPVSSNDLAEARMALRQFQESKSREAPAPATIAPDPLDLLLAPVEPPKEAELVKSEEEDVDSAPTTHPA
jgi:hypothetical protein